MKLVKSLLLGSAAGLAAMAGAQAADLPSRKAAPVAYVKICDAYGAGFFYIPGTDTCLKVGGRVRAEYAYISTGTLVSVAPGLASGVVTYRPSRSEDQTGFLARGVVILDARTQTAWGTARTYIGVRPELKSGLYADNGLTGTVTGQTGASAVSVENAIIQFAGFTFGRTTAENFSFLPSYNYASLFNAGYPGGINMLAYTATFGGGFSATIAIEDRASQTASINPGYLGASPFGTVNTVFAGGVIPAGYASAANGAGTQVAPNPVANGPQTWPVLVGNLRVDQGWGAAQIMGRVQQNSAYLSPFSNQNLNGQVTKIGWAVGGGLKVNLPMLAPGDVLNVTAAYADGDIDALQTGSTSAHTGGIGKEFNGLSRFDRDMYVFPGAPLTAANANRGSFGKESTKGFSIAGIFTHYWTPMLRSNIVGSYIHLTPGNRTQNTDWTLGGLSRADAYIGGGSLVFTPTKDFDIGLEVVYERINQRLTGTNGAAPTAVPVNGIAFRPSTGIVQTRLRVERTF